MLLVKRALYESFIYCGDGFCYFRYIRIYHIEAFEWKCCFPEEWQVFNMPNFWRTLIFYLINLNLVEFCLLYLWILLNYCAICCHFSNKPEQEIYCQLSTGCLRVLVMFSWWPVIFFFMIILTSWLKYSFNLVCSANEVLTFHL